MVEFEKLDDQLRLVYSPRDGSSWVHDKFSDGKALLIKGTFHLKQINVVDELPNDDEFYQDDRSIRFVVATAEGNYFCFDSEVLPVGCPVLIAKDACQHGSGSRQKNGRRSLKSSLNWGRSE